MKEIPEWWIAASGLFFVLASVYLLLLTVLIALIIRAFLDLNQSVKALTQKVDVVVDKVDTIATHAKTISEETSVRAGGILRKVDENAATAFGILDRIGPGIILGALVARLFFWSRRRR